MMGGGMVDQYSTRGRGRGGYGMGMGYGRGRSQLVMVPTRSLMAPMYQPVRQQSRMSARGALCVAQALISSIIE